MYKAMAAPIPDAPSTIKNKGITKNIKGRPSARLIELHLRSKKREVGFLSTNKRMGITTV